MGYFFKNKNAIIQSSFVTLTDFPQIKIKKGNIVEVALCDDHLEIIYFGAKPLTLNYNQIENVIFTLNYNQIENVIFTTESKIVEKEKSIAGRIIAGSILLGNTGAIIGAASSLKPKQKRELTSYFIIAYKSSSGESAFLIFEDISALKGRKLANKLKELCNIKDEPEEISTQL